MPDEERLDPRVEAPGRGSPVRFAARDSTLEQVSADDLHPRDGLSGRLSGGGR